MKRLMVILVMLCLAFSLEGAEKVLRLATTTSTFETGLLDKILPPFEKKNNAKVHVISVGTGKAIKLGENGDVDVILVHARKAEEKFIKDGHGVNRKDVMYNDFVLLGPKKDPASVSGKKSIVEAFKLINAAKSTFVSRGDDSGTHKKELILWSKVGVVPKGDWYLEVGQGMSATLRLADEKQGYVILDRATYLFNRKKVSLELMVEGDALLLNPYGVIAVNPDKHKKIKHKITAKFIDWLVSKKCQKMIGDFKVDGKQLFHPDAK